MLSSIRLGFQQLCTGSHQFVHAVDRATGCIFVTHVSAWCEILGTLQGSPCQSLSVARHRAGALVLLPSARSFGPHACHCMPFPFMDCLSLSGVGFTPPCFFVLPAAMWCSRLHLYPLRGADRIVLCQTSQTFLVPQAWTPAPWTSNGRVGEASNPGPCTKDAFRCAIINPTAINNKLPEILSLNADLVFVSETSAVACVQKTVAAGLRQHGFRSFFSSPVPPLMHDAVEAQSVRGVASGVAILARTPARPALSAFSEEACATSRILETFCRIGALEVRSICVYGLPSCHADAAHVNNFLLQTACERVQSSAVPAIVAGDWNCAVQHLPAFADFQRLGFMEAFAAAQCRLGLHLPPTCKAATRNDTALLAPALVEMLMDAQVLTDAHLFDSHSPLLLDFAMPVQLPCYRRWALPRTWSELDFSQDAFAQAYDASVPSVTATIEAVQTRQHLDQAGACEKAVDAALASCPASSSRALRHLPRSHRGRCRPVRTVHRPLPQLPRAGRAGDFSPMHETTSIRVKWKVRQCRRLRTFQGGLRKFCSLPDPPAELLQQLLNEWHAIVRAKGFGSSFQAWVLSWPCVDMFPLDFPTPEWIDSLVQLVEHQQGL